MATAEKVFVHNVPRESLGILEWLTSLLGTPALLN